MNLLICTILWGFLGQGSSEPFLRGLPEKSVILIAAILSLLSFFSETLTEISQDALRCSGVDNYMGDQDVISGLEVPVSLCTPPLTEEKAGHCQVRTHDDGRAPSSVQKSDPMLPARPLAHVRGLCHCIKGRALHSKRKKFQLRLSLK